MRKRKLKAPWDFWSNVSLVMERNIWPDSIKIGKNILKVLYNYIDNDPDYTLELKEKYKKDFKKLFDLKYESIY